MTEIKSGIASIDDLMKINALLDMQSDIEWQQAQEQKTRNQ